MVEARTWLESTKKRGMALGLKETRTVLDRLQLSLPEHILHVAGSNGKGTVCALMATSLGLDNIENVLFSSPHVVRLEERVRRNGIPLSSEEFDEALLLIHDAACSQDHEFTVDLTFFEVTYLVAMIASQGCSVLILETGLGGRLDATRCGPATASLVTSVTREHVDILGGDLPTIAREKAAIARPNCPIFIRKPTEQSVLDAMKLEANTAGNPELGEVPSPSEVHVIAIPSDSSVRKEAFLLALAVFQHIGLPTASLIHARQHLRWLARMQFLSSEATSSHPYLLDAAHNPSGLLRILPELEQYILQYAPKHNSLPVWSLVFGTSPQDDLGQFLEPLLDFCHRCPPKQIVLTRPQGGRYPGVSVDALIQQNWQRNDVQHYPLPVDAINALASCESKNVGLVVSLGSLYLQGNLLSAFGWSTDEHLSLYAKD